MRTRDREWKWRSLLVLLLASAGVFAIVLIGCDPERFVPREEFFTLAGFALIAAALERVGEFFLPWWGRAEVADVRAVAEATTPAPAPAPVLALANLESQINALPGSIGQGQAARLVGMSRATVSYVNETEGVTEETTKKAQDLAEKATMVQEKVRQARPTVLAPIAGLGMLVAAYFELYLIHAIGTEESINQSALSYALDAILTGFLLAGGAKPFHDLVDRISVKREAEAASAGATEVQAVRQA